MRTQLADFWTELSFLIRLAKKITDRHFVVSRGRILHSAAFRCLQAKTQIHAVGEK